MWEVEELPLSEVVEWLAKFNLDAADDEERRIREKSGGG